MSVSSRINSIGWYPRPVMVVLYALGPRCRVRLAVLDLPPIGLFLKTTLDGGAAVMDGLVIANSRGSGCLVIPLVVGGAACDGIVV
jgi:hypothetical protein